MEKVKIGLVAFAALFSVVWFLNPAPRTEPLHAHPYLGKCYRNEKPLLLEWANLPDEKMDCAQMPRCTGWITNGGGVIQDRKTVPPGAAFRVASAYRVHPGPTAATDYFVFEPLATSGVPTFYYLQTSACSEMAEANCLERDGGFREAVCAP